MSIDGIECSCDATGKCVPAELGGIGRIEVVTRILTGTRPSLDDVFVTVSDDDVEIVVRFHPPFGDGIDGSCAPVTVNVEDSLDDRWLQLAVRLECCFPCERVLCHVFSLPGSLKAVRMLFRHVSTNRVCMEVSEGGRTITVPALATDGIEDGVFYNPRQERNRDVTIATLRAYRDREPAVETYLDAMTATGIRGLRAAADGWSVTCCDRDPEAVTLCRENFQRHGLSGEVLERNVNGLLHEGRFDVVDLDPFGSPMPFVDAALVGTRQLLCVTATDTAPLCGAHYRAGIRRYGVVSRPTEYHSEVGLRVLISALCRAAAQYDLAIRPLLSHVEGHSVRTYLELAHGAGAADDAIDQLGTLWHCPECLYRETENGLLTPAQATCPQCAGTNLLTAGPLWLGVTHDPSFVEGAIAHLDGTMNTERSSRRMLAALAAELDEPTHYDQHVLCKRWNRAAGPIDAFLDAIREEGFEASRTHYGGTTFKTTADVRTIEQVTAQVNDR